MKRFEIGHLIVAACALVACRESNGAPAQKAPIALAPDIPNFVQRTVTDDGVTSPYYVFLPDGFDKAKRWPIIVAIHGSVERSMDADAPTRSGLGLAVRARTGAFPAIVVFPHIGLGYRGVELGERAVMHEIDATIAEFNGDPERVYLTGLSFGGTFALSLASEFPDRFAALIPISSGMCPRCVADLPGARGDGDLYGVLAKRLHALPTWIFHGEQDGNMPVANARAIVQALKAENAPVRYTEYPGAGHNVWDRTYADPEVLAWLLAQRRKP